jgi:hypothetical protein
MAEPVGFAAVEIFECAEAALVVLSLGSLIDERTLVA